MKGFFALKKQGCSGLICMHCVSEMGILSATLFSLLNYTLLNVCISPEFAEPWKIPT